MPEPLTAGGRTPGQTVGPFFHLGLPVPRGEHLVPPGHPGAVRLHGTVYDGAGDPVPDALLELRQADGSGTVPRVAGSLRRPDGEPGEFTGWGRCATDAEGHYAFTTVEPAPVAGEAAFFAVVVLARGLLDRLVTRAYLPGAAALAGDPLLSRLGPRLAARLVAEREGDDSLRFDVHLQGEHETVFLAFPGDRPG